MKRHRGNLGTFYVLVVTQALSMIGSRVTSIGVGIWVFSNMGSATPLLLTAFFTELPGMLGGSLAGVLVDRWQRRRVLILADAGQAAGTLLLLFTFLSGSFQLWHLYLIALVQGTFAVFQGPAKEAATTMLVPENHRERANAVQQMAFPLAGVAAPVVAGALYSLVGVTGIIAVDLLTFLVAICAIYTIHIPRPKATEEGLASRGNIWQELAGSFRYLRQRRVLLAFVLYLTFLNFMLNGPLELAIPYLISLTGSETIAGTLMGITSLGAFAGATAIAVWGGTRPRMHTLMPGMLFCGVMFLIYGVARSPVTLGISIFLLMVPLPIMGTMSVSILQAKTPPDMQGRIFALVEQMGFLGSTSSFLLTGPLVDRVLEPAAGRPGWELVAPLVGRQEGAGMGLLLVVTGLIIFVITLLFYLAPHIRLLELHLPDYEAAAADIA